MVKYLIRFLLAQAVVTIYFIIRNVTVVENIEPVITAVNIIKLGDSLLNSGQTANIHRNYSIISPPKLKSAFEVRQSTKRISNQAKIINTTKPSRKQVKVIIVSYMRGGSTVIGEIFNQNPSSAYWFESVDGAFASLYGLEFGIRTHEITHHNNRSYREAPELERAFILDNVHQMLNCDLSRLPIEILEHPFVLRGRQKSFTKFSDCVTKLHSPRIPLVCRDIHPLCQRKSRVHHVDRCAESHAPLLKDVKNKFRNILPVKLAQYLQNSTSQRYSQQRCYQALWKSYSLCKDHFVKSCDASKISILKTVRLTMADIEELLKEDPNIKVIHVLRDPRGIISSRAKVGLLSEQSFNNKGLEGKMLCDLMKRDISKRHELELEHPGNFLTVTYEDFAEHPVEIAEAMYKHVGLEMPHVVSAWLYNSTHAKSDGDAFKTYRKNATATAYSWKSTLKQQELFEISLFCKDLYDLDTEKKFGGS